MLLYLARYYMYFELGEANPRDSARVSVETRASCLRLRKSTRDQHQLIIQVQYTLLIPTFYDANFSRFSVSKINEEAKRSMTEWQEKLDKVTKDSEERISELQQKLSKVRDNIHELKHA